MSLILPDKNGTNINQNNVSATNPSTTTSTTSTNPKCNNEELINECKKLFDKIDNLCNSGGVVVVPPPTSSITTRSHCANGSSQLDLERFSASTAPTKFNLGTNAEQNFNDNVKLDNANFHESDVTNVERTTNFSSKSIVSGGGDTSGHVNCGNTNVENHSEERRVQISMTPATGTSVSIVPGLDNLCGTNSSVSTGQIGDISDDELRILICELKRRIEYIENMNWLCEYNFFIIFKTVFFEKPINLTFNLNSNISIKVS